MTRLRSFFELRSGRPGFAFSYTAAGKHRMTKKLLDFCREGFECAEGFEGGGANLNLRLPASLE
jgi:hypothetical protein